MPSHDGTTPHAATRALLACGAAAPLFLLVVLIEGAFRPGYDPVRHMSSALSLGERGWVQIANFTVTGLLMIAFAVGLRRTMAATPRSTGRTWGPLLVAVWGAGLIGAGVFVGDASRGYPPGTPEGPVAETTWHGTAHNVVSTVVFLALAGAALVFARRFATRPRHPGEGPAPRRRLGWALYSAATALALPLLQPLLHALTPGDAGGLIQKVTIAVGWTWVAALALRMRTDAPR